MEDNLARFGLVMIVLACVQSVAIVLLAVTVRDLRKRAAQ